MTVALPKKPDPLYMSILCPLTPTPEKVGLTTDVMRSVEENPVSDDASNTGADADGAEVSMSTLRPAETSPIFPARSANRADTT